MGCIKLHILDEQYKSTELKISYFNKELTENNSVENPRRWTLVKYVDPDGKDIKLYNVFLNTNGNYEYKNGVSTTTNSALKDVLSTKEGVTFFAQFAKAGDVVGGYKFTKDGALSNVTLKLWDYAFENGDVPPYVQSGSGSLGISDDKKTVTLKIVSEGTSKTDVGETITHETQLHGYSAADQISGKKTTTESQDHKALKNQDTKHQGYKQYKSVQEQLQTLDKAYKKSFEDEQKRAQIEY
ncbi:hypothetical protein FACS189421_13220 [Bacteroidia bacterium]|nr:hypothetical protein FACS189421_13220 [Bacteroidia bacterium]